MAKINQKDKKQLINERKMETRELNTKKRPLRGISKDKKDTINSTIKRVTARKQPFSVAKQAEYAAKAEAKALRIKQQKAKRLEKTIIISKKTKRGQPLMKDRINYLLKQIQESKK